MRIRDGLDAQGCVTITARNLKGQIVARRRVKNLVLSNGRQLIAAMLAGTDVKPSHFAIGTSGTVVNYLDASLGAEVARIALTTSSASGGIVTYSIYIPSTMANGSTLQECGLLNAAAGGVLFARATFSSIAKNSTITISFTWQITVTS